MGVFLTIVVGFVIGLVAKLLHPGSEGMGIIATSILGVGGSFFGGVIGQVFGWYQAGDSAGFGVSVIAAILLLVIYGRLRADGAGKI